MMAVGASCAALGQILELDDVVDLGAHRDVGDPLQDDLDHHRHPVLDASASWPVSSAGSDLVRVEHPDGLAAQASATLTWSTP